MREATLRHVVQKRLDEAADGVNQWYPLVFAALEGEAELRKQLDAAGASSGGKSGSDSGSGDRGQHRSHRQRASHSCAGNSSSYRPRPRIWKEQVGGRRHAGGRGDLGAAGPRPERLHEALRRLAIDATVVEVTRREGSIVEARPAKGTP